MAKRFGGTINIDIKDSVPDWEPYTQPIAAGGRAERALHRARRRGLLGDGAVRRADRDAEHQPDRRARPDLHELPHDGAVLADALVPADRPQPHDQRHGLHHRGRVGVPERERAHPVRVRDDRRGARRARLEHLHRRQVAPDRRGRDEPGLDARRSGRSAAGSSASTASSAPRRTSGIPDLVYDNHPVEQPQLAGGGLPLLDRPHRQGARVHPRRQGGRPRQAVLPLLLPRRRATPRTTRRRSGPTSTRASSTWATRPTASSCSSGQKKLGIVTEHGRAVADQPVHRRDEPDGKGWPELDTVRPWDSLTDDEKRLFCPDGRGLRGLPEPRRPPDRAAARLPRGARAARQHDHRARLRQRRLRRGRPERLGQREQVLQRHPRHDRGGTCRTSTSSAARRPTTTTRPAGRGRSTRRSSCGSATRTARAAPPTR